MNKKIYIDSTGNQIATLALQNSLITWALSKGIDTFLYYSLKAYLGGNSSNSYAITNTANADTLANFIEAARAAGIKSHIAVVGGYRELYDPYPNWEMEDRNGYYGYNPNGKGGSKLINNYHNYITLTFPATWRLKSFLKQTTSGGSSGGGSGSGGVISTQGTSGTSGLIKNDISGINLECEYWLDHTVTQYNCAGSNQCGVTKYGYYYGWIPTLSTASEQAANFKVWSAIVNNHFGWSSQQGACNEAYMGWFKPQGNELSEALTMVMNLNSINVHAYVSVSNSTSLSSYGTSLYNYTKSRLQWLGQAQQLYNPSKKMSVSIIYSMETGFTGNWMIANPTVTFDQLHNAYMTAYNLNPPAGNQYLSIDGYTLFQYSLSKTARP